MKRFTANLLFRYGVRGRSRRRALCESRLIVINARSAASAIAAAKRQGKSYATSYFNPGGDLFELEFVGLIDLVELTHLGPNEVWYSMFVSRNPQGKLKPASSFQACRKGGVVGDAWWMVPREMVAPSDRKPIRNPGRKRKRAGA